MDFGGYEVLESNGGIIVKDVRDFNPEHIFECGQCFRWIKQADGSFIGVVRDKVARISYSNNNLYISNTCFKDFVDLWYEYLDLKTDYSEIKRVLGEDKILREAVKFGDGIRLLKQDIWETLVSFIISSNNRIPRIMKSVEALAEAYGNKIIYYGKEYFTFPELDILSALSLNQIDICRAGFRCKYIFNSSQMIKNGIFDLDSIKTLPVKEARLQLTKLPGVGNKVADCTLLFSGTRKEVFPTDVWVKRIMEKLYFKREASLPEIQAFAEENFGEYAGIAQQYLFYYARENKI